MQALCGGSPETSGKLIVIGRECFRGGLVWLIRDSCRNVLKRAVYSCRLILGYLPALEESACRG